MFWAACALSFAALTGASMVRAEAVHEGTQGTTTNDGVYTKEQADEGKALFAEACEMCHSPGKFTGQEFKGSYVDRPLTVLNGAMAEMPLDAPGSLKPEQYAQLIAYFLSMNSYPTGTTPLAGDEATLKSITVAPRP